MRRVALEQVYPQATCPKEATCPTSAEASDPTAVATNSTGTPFRVGTAREAGLRSAEILAQESLKGFTRHPDHPA
jgi:hypothetical protein